MPDQQRHQRHQLTRRAAVTGVVAVPLLAACGGEGGDEGGATSATDPSTSAPAPGTSAGGDSLAATGDVPVGGGVILPDEDVVITQPESGVFKAFSATCTHQSCQVTKVDDGTIDCACHGSRFSIADGSVEAGPAPSPLPEKEITIANGQISLS